MWVSGLGGIIWFKFGFCIFALVMHVLMNEGLHLVIYLRRFMIFSPP